jgi:hypothetical protein
MMVSVERSVKWELAGKTEVLGEKPAPVLLCPPQIPHNLGSNPGRRGGNPEPIRLSYGMTSTTPLEKVVTLHTVRETMLYRLLDPGCCCMYRIYRVSTNVYEHPEGYRWLEFEPTIPLFDTECNLNPRGSATGWTASSFQIQQLDFTVSRNHDGQLIFIGNICPNVSRDPGTRLISDVNLGDLQYQWGRDHEKRTLKRKEEKNSNKYTKNRLM